MKHVFLLIALIFSIKNTCFAQAPIIIWEHTYGGGQMDEGNSIFEDQFDNLLISGVASSNALVFSIDNSGNQNWLKRYGGTYGTENAAQILRGIDGNIVFAGMASSTDGDVIGLHGATPGMLVGAADFWVVCLDTSGTILWQKCLGGTYDDEAYSIVQSPDSGYLIFGNDGSVDGDVNIHYGMDDLWLAKISRTGLLQWRRSYGGSNDDMAGKIISTSDGGFIFCSSSQSFDYDVTSNFGSYDAWIVKLSSTGIIQWQRNYGGTGDDIARDILQTNGGDYFLIGNTNSIDGDITDPKGQGDILVMKIDSTGSLLWSHCVGGSQNEIGYAGCITPNGVEVVGYTESDDSAFSSNHGYSDIAAFEIDNNGNMLWSKCLGGSDFDKAYSVVSTHDGGTAIAGYTLSSDGDVSVPNAGNEQAWVIKLSPNLVKVDELPKSHINFTCSIVNGSLVLNCNSDKIRTCVLRIYDLTGRIKLEKLISLDIGNNNLSFPVSVSNGVYVVNIFDKETSFISEVFSLD